MKKHLIDVAINIITFVITSISSTYVFTQWTNLTLPTKFILSIVIVCSISFLFYLRIKQSSHYDSTKIQKEKYNSVINWINRNNKTASTIVSILIGGFIGIFGLRIFNYIEYGPNPTIYEHKNEPGKVYITPDFDKISDTYKKYTQIQADKMSSIFIGKWIFISGYISDILTTYNTITVRLRSTMYNKTPQFLQFDKKWADQIETYQKGDVIYAVCKIDSINDGVTYPNNCEIADKPQ